MRHHAIRAAGLSSTALLILAAAVRRDAAPATPNFTDTTTVTVVEVPVHVVRDGEPVSGLTAADFEVFDDGKRQEISGFEVVDLYRQESASDSASATEGPSIAARRHFLFLFDRAFSAPDSLERARTAAGEILEQLHASDLAAVAEFGAATGTVFSLGFTSDRAQARVAIRAIGAPQLVDRHPDPLRLFLGDILDDGAGGGSSGAAPPLPGSRDDEYEQQLRQLLKSAGEMEKADQRARIATFQRGLQGLAATIASIEGSKHVILLSEGYDDRALVGQEMGQEERAARESGLLWDVNSNDSFGDTRVQGYLRDTVVALQRSGAVIQAVDIGRLRPSARPGGNQGLFALARDTGGELYESFNDLGTAMGQMLRRTGVTYLLSFQPTKVAADGKAHKLEVKLRDAARGTRVLHRPGYWAPKPWETVTAEERRLTTAELMLDRTDSGSIDVATLVAPQPTGAPRWYVPVLLEVGGGELLAGTTGKKVDVELFGYAFDKTGAVVDYFVQGVGLDLEQVGGTLREAGLKHWGHLDLEPGRYDVRIVVRNATTGEHGARTVELEVPDFESGEVALLPPLVPEPQGRWLLVREPVSRQRDVPYPFLAGGQPFIPAALPRVPRQGSTAIVLQGFHLPEPSFSASVRDAEGGVVPQASVQVDGLEAADGGGAVARATLETDGLPPGRYRLEVRAAGELRSTEVRVD